MKRHPLSSHTGLSCLVSLVILTAGILLAGTANAELEPIEQLGSSIFFDEDLSINRNQSCAACHDPAWGFTGPDTAINAAGAVYEGSIAGRFGNRKPPSAAYASFSPILYFVEEGPMGQGKRHGHMKKNKNKGGVLFIGGNFFDGQATGEKLGTPVADQAQGPFLNPMEQGLPDSACVVYRVCEASYPVTLEDVFGPEVCDVTWPADVATVCAAEGTRVTLSPGDRETVDTAYDNIAIAIAAFEDSADVNRFSSKYDAYLRGEVKLSKQERKGLALFKGKGRCDNCHVLDAGSAGEPPLLTDNTFDNIGVPRNPDNPWYTMPSVFNPDGINWIDKGLGGFLAMRPDYQQYAPQNYGKQRVPTLRNVAAGPSAGSDKAYMHNGYFKSLKTVVHFYNTRDVKPACPDPFTRETDALTTNCWPEPEVGVNVNAAELGNLHMTGKQEDAIVAFLATLSDGFTP